MNTWHLLQIAFASLGVVTAFTFVAGLIMKWRFAVSWTSLGDLLLYGLCGMLFGLAMAGGLVGLIEFVLRLFIGQASVSLCLPGTATCTHALSADLRDLAARIFLTGTALLGAFGAMRLRLHVDDTSLPGEGQVQK